MQLYQYIAHARCSYNSTSHIDNYNSTLDMFDLYITYDKCNYNSTLDIVDADITVHKTVDAIITASKW